MPLKIALKATFVWAILALILVDLLVNQIDMTFQTVFSAEFPLAERAVKWLQLLVDSL